MLKVYILRTLSLILAFGGLLVLGYYIFIKFPDIEADTILCITVPDLLFFYLAYKTYPEPANQRTGRQLVK